MTDSKLMKKEYDKGGKFKDFVDGYAQSRNRSIESVLEDKVTELVYEDYIKRRIGVYKE